MPVVLAPGDSGILLHEAVGHGLEADFNRKGTSNYTGQVGKAVASEQFKSAIHNIGDEVAYLDQPDFARFWDADAKRVEAAVQSIGKVQG